MTKIKFCGLTRPCDIEAANEIRPDYIGFVFVSNSRRCVSDTQAAKLKELLRKDIIAVGVFLNDEIEHVISLLKSGVIDAAQLHGDESNEDIVRIQQETNKPVIKAFRIRSKEDIAAAEMTNADYMMFDAGAGEGKTFDWEMIKTIRKPYFLAGGLNADNVSKALCRLHPFALDVSTGIETDHQKDKKKMADFASAVRKDEA